MRVQRLDVSVFRVPTDGPEADGTFAWDSTTMVLVEAIAASGACGLGFSYCAAAAARRAIGPSAELFVDANGAYSASQAVEQARRFAEHGVGYFEEPVFSDHLDQLAFVRQHAPMAIAAGEYGYDPWYFREMLRAGAVDNLQADATRCLGVTAFLEVADVAHAFAVPFSAHTAPTIHAHAGCAAPRIDHVEYFYDHARIERMLLDGAPEPREGLSAPGSRAARPGAGAEAPGRGAVEGGAVGSAMAADP